jgi:hypothetical protein
MRLHDSQPITSTQPKITQIFFHKVVFYKYHKLHGDHKVTRSKVTHLKLHSSRKLADWNVILHKVIKVILQIHIKICCVMLHNLAGVIFA